MTTGHPHLQEPCSAWHARIEAFIDGELGETDADAVRDHLRRCPACLAEAEVLADLNQGLRALRIERSPADLWSWVDTRIGALSLRETRATRLSAAWMSRRTAMVTAASVAVVAVAAVTYGMRPSGASVVTASVDDFITYRARGWTVDHAARDGSSLAAWAQARVAFAVPELRERFGAFEVSGVRLCWLLNRRLLGLTYSSGEDRAVIYVMERQGLPLPSADRTLPDGRPASIHHAKGHGVAVWTEKDLVFVLVAAEKDFGRALPLARVRAGRVHRPDTS